MKQNVAAPALTSDDGDGGPIEVASGQGLPAGFPACLPGPERPGAEGSVEDVEAWGAERFGAHGTLNE